MIRIAARRIDGAKTDGVIINDSPLSVSGRLVFYETNHRPTEMGGKKPR